MAEFEKIENYVRRGDTIFDEENFKVTEDYVLNDAENDETEINTSNRDEGEVAENNQEQAGAELCQAQGKLNIFWP